MNFIILRYKNTLIVSKYRANISKKNLTNMNGSVT